MLQLQWLVRIGPLLFSKVTPWSHSLHSWRQISLQGEVPLVVKLMSFQLNREVTKAMMGMAPPQWSLRACQHFDSLQQPVTQNPDLFVWDFNGLPG
jgi:hypothetical protein